MVGDRKVKHEDLMKVLLQRLPALLASCAKVVALVGAVCGSATIYCIPGVLFVATVSLRRDACMRPSESVYDRPRDTWLHLEDSAFPWCLREKSHGGEHRELMVRYSLPLEHEGVKTPLLRQVPLAHALCGVGMALAVFGVLSAVSGGGGGDDAAPVQI